MKLSKEKLLVKVKDYIGDETSEEAVSLLEDVDDSMSDSDDGDWEQKYHELDESWKQKYIERFGSGDPEQNKEDDSKEDESKEDESKEDDSEEKTFDELFEKGDD